MGTKITEPNFEEEKIPQENNLFRKHNHTMISLTLFDFESFLSHTPS